MDFTSAAAMDDVRDCLMSIEDKIYERGTLVTLTKDNEAEVTISYEMFDVGFGLAKCLLIRIESEVGNRPSEDAAEGLCDYVMCKMSDMMELLEDGVREALDDLYVALVLFNGKVVY